MIEKSLKTNIVIAGAGLVGTSFALSMKNRGLSIHILETHLPDLFTQPQTDSRPISLSFGSVRILEALGVWNALEELACPILNVHVSEQGRFGVTHFTAAEQKVSALGYVVPFAKLQSALYHAAAAQSDIIFTSIQSIDAIHTDTKGAEMKANTTSGELMIQADLFVAADGTQSSCRDLLGISHTEKDSGDIAHIYQLALSETHHHTAYERFTKFGVLAVLPLHNNHRAQLVWTMTPRIANKTADWDDAKILLFLQDSFEGRLSITDVKKSAQFPLKTVIAEKQIMQSAVLLGNAAHTIYPVAAQGFNLGLHDAALLSDVLMDAKKSLGDLSVLKNYEAQVSKHQEAIFCITDQLTSIFELPLMGGLRGLGLLTTDLITPIKNKLAKRTMGITEKLPRLLRRKRHE